MAVTVTVLHDVSRDARMRAKARETIRYALDGAVKDGLSVPARGEDESWEELCHARDVLDLLRERDALRLAGQAALAHTEELRMDTPDDQAVVEKLANTIRMALS